MRAKRRAKGKKVVSTKYASLQININIGEVYFPTYNLTVMRERPGKIFNDSLELSDNYKKVVGGLLGLPKPPQEQLDRKPFYKSPFDVVINDGGRGVAGDELSSVLPINPILGKINSKL
jgi:hypothetical protein